MTLVAAEQPGRGAVGMARAQLTTCDSELGLADVLIYDIADAELLLLLLPHQLHALVDKNILFLQEKTK